MAKEKPGKDHKSSLGGKTKKTSTSSSSASRSTLVTLSDGLVGGNPSATGTSTQRTRSVIPESVTSKQASEEGNGLLTPVDSTNLPLDDSNSVKDVIKNGAFSATGNSEGYVRDKSVSNPPIGKDFALQSRHDSAVLDARIAAVVDSRFDALEARFVQLIERFPGQSGTPVSVTGPQSVAIADNSIINVHPHYEDNDSLAPREMEDVNSDTEDQSPGFGESDNVTSFNHHHQEDDSTAGNEDVASSSSPVTNRWIDLLASVASNLGIELEEPEEAFKPSILHQSFVGLPSAPRPKAPVLPMETIIPHSWNMASKDPSRCFSAPRQKDLYKWPQSDFESYSSVPEVEDDVMTYITLGASKTGDHTPRRLTSREKSFEDALIRIDRVLRSQQRAISHSAYMLASLTKGLKTASTLTDEQMESHLAGIASAIHDIADTSVKASAKCVDTRRGLYLEALNLPTLQDKSKLKKLPANGNQLFGGMFGEYVHSAGDLIRDMSDSINSLASSSGRKRTARSSESEPPAKHPSYRSLDKKQNKGKSSKPRNKSKGSKSKPNPSGAFSKKKELSG